MKKHRRLVILFAVLIVAGGISAWVNVPPWLARRRAVEHYRQGLAYARQGVMDSALAEWRIATRMDPEYAAPYHRIGEFLLEKAQRPDLASDVFARLAELDPDGPHVYCNLAKALVLRDEVAEARQYARLAVKTEPDCALAHNVLGIILLSDQQVGGGMKELEQGCALAPRNTDFALVLAQAYLDTSNFPGAEKVLDEVLAREPGNAKAHFLLGWACVRRVRTPDAVAKALLHFCEVTRLDPDDAEAYSEWGKLLLQTGRKEEAVRVLRKAWAINPGLSQVAHNLTVAYRETGQEASAAEMERQERLLTERMAQLRVLQKRVKNDPHDTDAVLQLAETELQDGNLADSLRYVQAVLRQQPAERRALRLLAQIYVVGGKPELAEEVRKHLASLPGQTLSVGGSTKEAALPAGTSGR